MNINKRNVVVAYKFHSIIFVGVQTVDGFRCTPEEYKEILSWSGFTTST